jgi:hypothetical protein
MMKRVFVTISAAAALLMGCPPPEPTDACKGRVAGDLVLTEVMLDPEGTDTGGEWIELFNTLGTPLDLKGLTLYIRDTDGSGAKTHAIRAGTAPARGYFVVGDIRSGPNPSWVNYAYGDALGSMGNSRGVVGVRCGMTTLAEFTYNTAAKPQRSRMLNGNNEPNSTIAAVEANYCDTPTGNLYIGNNSGTPGVANPECMAEATSGTCVDNGVVRAMTSPQAGDLVITEVMASPAATGDTTGEWIEILARATVDLNDVTINTTTSNERIENQACLRVQPGEYVLLARSADTFVNGDLPAPFHVYGSISFADTTNQRISLSRGDAGIDEIALTPSASGKAWQLDPLKLDPGSNDDPANFCRAPFKWNPDGGGDYGSPGAANPDCPIDAGQADPNVCFDTALAANRPIRRPADGELVITEWMSDPSAVSDLSGEFVEVLAKNDFDLNGLVLQIGTGRTPLSSANCISVTTNSFLVFGKNGDPAQNGLLPPLVASFSEAMTATKPISLLGPDGGVYDTVTPTGETAGASTQIAPGFENPTDNDVAANRCRSPNKWNIDGGGDFGSPGALNPACGAGDAGVAVGAQCFDIGLQALRDIVPPQDGELVITEWMTNSVPVPQADGEYFEVLAKGAFDLNGLRVRTGTTGAGTPFTSATNCLPTTANSYFVFGRNGTASANGNLPTLAGIFTGTFTATSTIQVLNADGGVHDTVTASGETAGVSVQVNSDFLTVADNQTQNCQTRVGVQYGPALADGGVSGNRGTPGLPNHQCP